MVILSIYKAETCPQFFVRIFKIKEKTNGFEIVMFMTLFPKSTQIFNKIPLLLDSFLSYFQKEKSLSNYCSLILSATLAREEEEVIFPENKNLEIVPATKEEDSDADDSLSN